MRGTLEALIPASANVDLLSIRALRAQVTGQCVNGSPQLTGTSSVAGITVLGKDLPVDKAVSQTLSVVNSENIDPSALTPAQLGLPAGPLDPVVQTFLDTLPNVVVPATNLRVVAAPGKKTEGGGALTQHALDLSVSVAGQSLVDLTVGSATVGSAQVNCGGVADQALECTSRPIVLIDVLRRGKRVHLLGAANRRFAGRRVRIRFTATGKTVARPKVRNTGLFKATAKIPRAKVRSTNRARYIATIGKQKSLRLKLSRRMVVTSTKRSGSKVTIAGHITGRVSHPPKTIVVQRRLSCGRYKVIKRFKPRANGRFSDHPARADRERGRRVPPEDAGAASGHEAVSHVHVAEVHRPRLSASLPAQAPQQCFPACVCAARRSSRPSDPPRVTPRCWSAWSRRGWMSPG